VALRRDLFAALVAFLSSGTVWSQDARQSHRIEHRVFDPVRARIVAISDVNPRFRKRHLFNYNMRLLAERSNGGSSRLRRQASADLALAHGRKNAVLEPSHTIWGNQDPRTSARFGLSAAITRLEDSRR
jgi:hypothetical protein